MSAEGKININGINIKLLSPSQSIKDRLASFFYFHDRQCLDQAVMIFKNQNVSLEAIEKWAKNEGGEGLKKFNIFKKNVFYELKSIFYQRLD